MKFFQDTINNFFGGFRWLVTHRNALLFIIVWQSFFAASIHRLISNGPFLQSCLASDLFAIFKMRSSLSSSGSRPLDGSWWTTRCLPSALHISHKTSTLIQAAGRDSIARSDPLRITRAAVGHDGRPSSHKRPSWSSLSVWGRPAESFRKEC